MQKVSHLFPYKWKLSDGYKKSNGLNVFGTFVCGGGSTMGYKLAGFNHLGGVELVKEYYDLYKMNHSPKYIFNQDIRLFNQREDLPEELYSLDILDGSPPCASFSMVGSREKKWGQEKKYENVIQKTDDLVFVYCETIKKLNPKVFILENVKGIIQGNAKIYSKKIIQTMEKAGYSVQVFLLNSASMGVPQKRERVFFVGSKRELKFSKLILEFNEKPVLYKEIEDKEDKEEVERRDTRTFQGWVKSKIGESFKQGIADGGSMFGYTKIGPNCVARTVVASNGTFEWHYKYFRKLNTREYLKIGSFPLDYNFNGIQPKNVIGRSVPPVMTAQIANQIYEQWFK